MRERNKESCEHRVLLVVLECSDSPYSTSIGSLLHINGLNIHKLLDSIVCQLPAVTAFFYTAKG